MQIKKHIKYKKTLKKQEQKIFFYTSSPELRFWETDNFVISAVKQKYFAFSNFSIFQVYSNKIGNK